MRSIFGLSVLALSLLTTAVGAEPHGSRRNHDGIARRAKADVSVHEKRSFSNARFTYYDVGLGACGKNNVPSDFIVALNTPQYGGGYPGPNCFKSITITYGGKTAQATIMDECPGCPYGGLDMSTGLFDFFASASLGVLYGEWWFNDGSGGSGGDGGGGHTTTTSKYTPPPYTPPPQTHTTHTTPHTTSTSTTTHTTPHTTSTTSYSSSSAKPSASSIDFSSGAASGLAVPSGTVSIGGNGGNGLQVILGMNEAIVGIGGLIIEAQLQ